jgi:hypothetical protein
MMVIIGKDYSAKSERGTGEGLSVAKTQKDKNKIDFAIVYIKNAKPNPLFPLQMYLKFKLVQILNTPSTKRGFNEVGACGFTPTVFKLVSPNIIPLLPESFYILYENYM